MQNEKDVLSVLEECIKFETPLSPDDAAVVLRTFKANFELLKIYRELAASYKEEVQNG